LPSGRTRRERIITPIGSRFTDASAAILVPVVCCRSWRTPLEDTRATKPPLPAATRKRLREAGRKAALTRRVSAGVSLKDLIAAGFLVPPVRLFRKYKGHELEARHTAHTSLMSSALRGRVPRVSRLLALALRLDELVRTGVIADYATLAQLAHVS